ncbi:MAG: nucleotide sugar dehydrogenase, partial [Geobacteraceae bacterium]|nr:nucleotide sugar dehydrogenase [Geobacteraceae bacterium]
MQTQRIISVIGLGYVGLPVAIAFGKVRRTIGFDINPHRISELKNNYDRTCEVTAEDLQTADILFTDTIEELALADFHIVAVPTPVDEANQPDLTLMLKASETVGKALKKGDIVVYESTVYPGVTEDECVPVLEKTSGLTCGTDFTVGYSPERINPGDKEHTFTKIRKVVSGQDAATLETVAQVYESVVTAGVFRAASIKVAEAAKVIENTQRDLNIALMNELALIFDRMAIDTNDVLEAAGTKWNFLKFKPGLVGGHCIGVDPYYLTHKAEKIGYIPQVILAGRRINDGMGR